MYRLVEKTNFFPQIYTAKIITNDKLTLRITEKIKGNGNCKKRKVIYAAQCSKHKALYTGHTGEQILECFSKHRKPSKICQTIVNLQNITI